MRREFIKPIGPLVPHLPPAVRLMVADVGSIGGLHHRWAPLSAIVDTLSFDPLDTRPDDKRHQVMPMLAGASAGEATLYVTRRATMSSTLKPDRSFFAPFWAKPGHIEIIEEIRAPTCRLDDALAQRSLVADAIKIDVQGGEAAVLEGAATALSTSILCAEIECSFVPRYEGQQTFDQIVARMRDHGFALFDLRRLKRYRYRNDAGVVDPSLGRGMRAGRLAFCDAIFFLEPDRLWSRMDAAGADRGTLGAKAMMLALVYGKADYAAAIFDRCRDALPDRTRGKFSAFFDSLQGNGGWLQALHLRIDRLARSL